MTKEHLQHLPTYSHPLDINTSGVVAGLQALSDKVDEFHQKQNRTSRELKQVGLDIRDLQRNDDEQIRNFATLANVMDNIWAEIKDLRMISCKLLEGQESLARRIDRSVQVEEEMKIDETVRLGVVDTAQVTRRKTKRFREE